ncbi:MAG TPA: TonB-dependent receptor [Polyangiaceae bacterium]|nr:TonB-dependent receptor [Polyangiaceae bacterium]
MRRRRIALGVLAGTLFAGSALADGSSDLEALLDESVVTTASTTAETASSAPGTSVTLTADDFRTFGIRTLAEAIDFLSLGMTTGDPLKTPDVGARGVMLLGDDGKHFLLLVNGHAINDPLFGAARFDQGAGIPIDAIDHVEVILGPGSVLYGSNAMAGVINVITKTGSTYKGGHLLADFEPGRSARGGAGIGTTFELFGAPAELSSSVEYYERFGPDLHFPEHHYAVSGVAYRKGGAFDSVWGGNAKEAYFARAPQGVLRLKAGQFDVTVMGSAYERGIPYTDRVYDVDFDDPKSLELDRSLRVDLRHDATPSTLVQLTSRAYADYFDYQRRVNRNARYECFRSDFETCQYYTAGLASWAGLEERLSLNWLSDSSLVTLVGVDARLRHVRAKQDALDLDTGQAFAPTRGHIADTLPLVSPYVQQTWSPVRVLDLNAGARLDVDPRFSAILSPRAAAAVRPFEKTVVKVVYSQAFRAPTWAETDSANYQVAPSDVKPEKVRSIEGSIEQRFGPHRVLFGVFRTRWEDLVESSPLAPADQAALQAQGVLPFIAQGFTQFHNLASIDNYGYNAGLSGAFASGKLRYGVNATAAYTRQAGEGVTRELEASPQMFGNARLALSLGEGLPVPALAVRYVSSRLVDRAYEATYASLPEAPAYAELKGTLSGDVGRTGVGYTVSATWATTGQSAYVAGPALLGEPALAYAPIDRFRAFVGLRWDFMGDTSRKEAP